MVATVKDRFQQGLDGEHVKGMWAWTTLRILLGWSFIWAFIDKMFGFGFSTCRAPEGSSIDFFCNAAMIKGGSPTFGFLTYATPNSHLGSLFDWMASSGPDKIGVADVLFMAALLLGGLSMMLGVGVRTAGIGSALLMLFMFLASEVWPENNPVNSSHIIEMVAFLGIATVGPGAFSLQKWVDAKIPALSKIK
jgi:thiosulfate dehydrogenase [quinone] large subunit